jgi:F0F1-type ATP synthase assembly protein I
MPDQLTPEEEQKRLEIIQQQGAAAKDLASTYEKMKKSLSGITAEEEEVLNISKQLSKTANDIEKSSAVRLDKTSSVKNLFQSLNKLKKDEIALAGTLNKLESAYTDKVNLAEQLKREQIANAEKQIDAEEALGQKASKVANLNRTIAGYQERILDAQSKGDRNEVSRLNNLKRRATLEVSIAREQERDLKIDYKLATDNLNLSKKQSDEAEEQVKLLRDGVTAHGEIKKALDEEIKATQKQVSATALLKRGFDNITKSFTLGALLKQVFDFVVAADAQVTELGKSLGISKNQARGLRDNFASYATSTGDAFVTTKKLMEAQGELTQELGVAGVYTGKQTEDFSRLTKLMGLSAGEAGKLARLSVINGKSIEATTKSVIKGSVAAQQANKVSFDQRTILKEVANLSEGILVKFQGNPEALGAAVVQAKALGLSLEQVDKIGDSLLNFESSIENELKAELITGKQINLEKARSAALTGDQAALSAEVASQAGDLASYQKMNVIAQNSLAEAFGMGREEMSKMLMDQEKFNKLGDVSNMTLQQQLENLKAQGEPIDSVLYKQIQQQSIQEKFNNAMEKMQEIIGNLVAGPLGSMLDVFAELANHASILYGIIGLIAGVSLVKTIGSLVVMGIEMGVISVEAITANAALTFGLGTIAVLAAAGAMLGMMNSAKSEATQPVQDGIAPASKGPFTITDKYGAMAMTAPGDSLGAAPGLSRGGGMDITPMISAINEVRNAINALASKSSDVHLDGQKVGKTLGGVKALGTSQVQNSYQVA